MPLFYEDFFARDTLLWQDSLLFRDRRDELFTASSPSAWLLPESLHRSDTVTGAVLMGIMMVLLIIRQNRNQLKTRVENFLFPSNIAKDKVPVSGREVMRLFLAMLMSLMVGLLFFAFAQTQWNIQLMPVSPVQLLGIYTLTAFLYLLFKQTLLAWVHSVFFTRTQRHTWRDNYALLFAFETLLMFPLALSAIYSLPIPHSPLSIVHSPLSIVHSPFSILHSPFSIVAYALAAMLVLVKGLMLIKSYAAYFRSLSASLHLVLYFLAVEVVPLVFLWYVLVAVTLSMNTFVPLAP